MLGELRGEGRRRVMSAVFAASAIESTALRKRSMMAKNNKNVPFDPKVFLATVNGGHERVGCDPGPVDGDWGAKCRAALQLFNRHAATSLNTDEATNKALDAVSGKTARVCPLVCGRGMKADGDTYVAVLNPRAGASGRASASRRRSVSRW